MSHEFEHNDEWTIQGRRSNNFSFSNTHGEKLERAKDPFPLEWAGDSVTTGELEEGSIPKQANQGAS